MSTLNSDTQKMSMQNSILLPKVVQLINEGHTVTLTAKGNSMMPFIQHDRDQLVFGQLHEVKVGMPVLAEISKGVFVCHRIESINGNKVTLRGDGNIQGTEQCTTDEVRAELVSIVRKGKTYDLHTSRSWHIYSAIWPRLLPCRRILLALYRLLWNRQLPARFTKRNNY